ncbi:hypothetical protein L484_017127 [Morus notabilis]|uniref:Uncharacterized protein n=1 Tax=Morus notabilis TaxID=981085 RepID=W9QVW3_9ROSA|nr:hypothetical protein L484_017127 [Morus notabilis]
MGNSWCTTTKASHRSRRAGESHCKGRQLDLAINDEILPLQIGKHWWRYDNKWLASWAMTWRCCDNFVQGIGKFDQWRHCGGREVDRMMMEGEEIPIIGAQWQDN